MTSAHPHPEGLHGDDLPDNVITFPGKRAEADLPEITHRRPVGSYIGTTALVVGLTISGAMYGHAHRPHPVKWCVEGEVAQDRGFTSAVINAGDIYGLPLTEHDADQIGGGVARKHPRAIPQPNDPVSLGLDAGRHIVSADAGACGAVYPGATKLQLPGVPTTPAGATAPR